MARSSKTARRAQRPASPLDATSLVAENLRRLRLGHGLSLARLAAVAGVSRATLGQIELGQSTPTVNTLWRVARALGVSFAVFLATRQREEPHLVRAGEGRVLTSREGGLRCRALGPVEGPRRVELYELRLDAGARAPAAPHASGTTENIVVVAGALIVRSAGSEARLDAGDAIFFTADVPHAYENPGAVECVAHLVMTYPEEIG